MAAPAELLLSAGELFTAATPPELSMTAVKGYRAIVTRSRRSGVKAVVATPLRVRELSYSPSDIMSAKHNKHASLNVAAAVARREWRTPAAGRGPAGASVDDEDTVVAVSEHSTARAVRKVLIAAENSASIPATGASIASSSSWTSASEPSHVHCSHMRKRLS
jgi:hypothetical protein